MPILLAMVAYTEEIKENTNLGGEMTLLTLLHNQKGLKNIHFLGQKTVPKVFLTK